MKIAGLFTLQVCALLMCHTTADTGPRPKRTLKFFENLMDTMREAFGPEPPDLPPPEVIAKIATLPYSNPYTYFPTIRMHVRPVKPVEKRVVYVKTIPAPAPGPLTMKSNLNDVEIIRLIQPLVRRPKSNTATIHYEIIPITIPIQEVHMPINHSPPSRDSEFENEDTSFSNIPWTIDALPPPVPTSKPFDSGEEHLVPWQLQALPPPVATKRPSWQAIIKPVTPNEDEVFFPMKKKIRIPATSQQQPRMNFFDNKFMPSPLQSEISVQPSMELTAFSETDSITVPPISNFRGRRLFDKKSNPKSRPKRDTWANFPIYVEIPSIKSKRFVSSSAKPAVQIVVIGNHSVPFISSVAPVPPLAFDAKKFSKALPPLEESNVVRENPVQTMDKHKDFGLKSKLSNRIESNVASKLTNDLPMVFDFGQYSGDADREDSKLAHSEKREKRVNFTDDTVSIVKSHDILSDYPTHHEYIPVTRRSNSSRKFLNSDKKSKLASRRLSSSLFKSPDNAEKQFDSPRTSFNKQSETSERRRPSNYFDSSKFSSFPKEDLKIPQTGYISASSQKDPYDDIFGERHAERDSSGRYFDRSKPTSNFASSSKYDFDKLTKSTSNLDKNEKYNNFGKSAKYTSDNSPKFDYKDNFDKFSKSNENKENEQPHSDNRYDNIEYFEPVIIDIDSGEKSFGNFFSKFRSKPKLKMSPPIENKHGNEPLKLPDSLHETVDFIKTKSAHPPTFDLMSEADEHTAVAMIEQNEIR